MIEVVRGEVGPELQEELVRFWIERNALDERVARIRAPQVLCVLRDDAGQIAGVNSAYAEEVPAVGARTFWIYRMLIDEAHQTAAAPGMLETAFGVLSADFDGTGPIGFCVFLPDPSIFPDHKRAFWEELDLTYAGYLPDGRQVRLRYFDDARV